MKDWFTVEKIDNNTFAISEYSIGKKHIATCYAEMKRRF